MRLSRSLEIKSAIFETPRNCEYSSVANKQITINVNSVKAILDANRNSLMLLDLKFSIGTLATGSGAFVASLYGMNLKNFIEESDLGFLGVTAWSAILAAVVCTYGLKKLRRVQRVSMWGEQGSRSRGPWTDINNPLPAIPGDLRVERQRRLELARFENGEDGAGGREGSEVKFFPTVIEGKTAKGK